MTAASPSLIYFFALPRRLWKDTIRLAGRVMLIASISPDHAIRAWLGDAW
jgi:hypothetical protein